MALASFGAAARIIPGTTLFPQGPSTAPATGRPVHWDVAEVLTRSVLDRVHQRLRDSVDDVQSAMEELHATLWSVKSIGDEASWDDTIERCLAHPLRDLIHEDPFAYRCYSKPRGYAGDAPLIDYLYTCDCESDTEAQLSTLGRRIFDFTCNMSAGQAVRRRRDLMAQAIDQTCQQHSEARILSVACGHLREASLCSAVPAGAAKRFVALDQDRQSLNVVEKETGHFGVTTVHDSIKALFRGSLAQEKFDLIYSTGLYDYLDDRIASRLTARLFDMLDSGGRLIVANFVPELVCSPYMEAFLDWKLIYRNTQQVAALTSGIDPAEIAQSQVYLENNNNIVFLDITKN